jgi:hypothetical protein
MQLTCEHCGAVFVVPPRRSDKRRYCSRKCDFATRNGRGYGRKWPSLPERFWAKVLKSDGCWEWIGLNSKIGYGQIKIGHTQVAAHRVSWELHVGPIPAGSMALHHCDNRACVRPDHLYLGTQTDNMRDMWARHRAHPNPYRDSSTGQFTAPPVQLSATTSNGTENQSTCRE